MGANPVGKGWDGDRDNGDGWGWGQILVPVQLSRRKPPYKKISSICPEV